MWYKNNKIMETNVIFKAKRIDNGNWIEGFFTKKKINGLFVPVIERIKEWDNGDYIESIEVDGNTIEKIEYQKSDNIKNRYFIFSSKHTIRDRWYWKKTEFRTWIYIGDKFPSIYNLFETVKEKAINYRDPVFTFSKLRVTDITILSISELTKEEHNKFWLDNK